MLGCGMYRTYCLFNQPLMAPLVQQAHSRMCSGFESSTGAFYISQVLQLIYKLLVLYTRSPAAGSASAPNVFNPLLRLVPNNTLFAPVGVDLDKKHSVLITLGSHCQQEQRLTSVLLN